MVSFMDRAAVPARLGPHPGSRIVLLNLETEQYFGLDETGTRNVAACNCFAKR